MYWPTLLVVLIGVTSATLICSDFGTYQDRTYYTKPIPVQCRGRHGQVLNYRPTYRITEKYSKCPNGWKEYSGHCYWTPTERPDRNFMEHETNCNLYKAHIYVANTREEYLWIENNVMNHDTWYYNGIFCSGDMGRTLNIAHMRTVTGEDLSEIQKKTNFRMENNHWISQFDHNCAMTHRNNNDWRWKWHHQSCNDNRRAVCEALLG